MITGYRHFVMDVDDLAESRAFYGDFLGFERLDDDGADIADGPSVVLAAAGNQRLVLAKATDRVDLTETGVHWAFSVSTTTRGMIRDRLEAAGVEILTYHEDRPAEEKDNFYVFDPSGNRVQIVLDRNATDGPPTLDHAAVQVADIMWAENFYVETLGLSVEHRVGWATPDYLRAKDWAAGKDHMAPGTRRMDKRYSAMVDKAEIPRVNMQVYLRADSVPLAVYLANQHFQEPPMELARGVPRIAFAVAPGGLGEIQTCLMNSRYAHEGPIEHAGGSDRASVYVRDPGGNFIEFTEPR